MRVWLLGGFRVSVGGRTIKDEEWRLRKAAGLVKLLALAPGHRLHRERAMDLLWPVWERAASNNLRQVLHAARRILSPTERLPATVHQTANRLCCAPGATCGWTPMPSRTRQPPRGARGSPRPTGRPWTCTRETCCPKTATKRGRRTGAKSFGSCTWRCSSASRSYRKKATSTAWQSRRFARRRPRNPRSKKPTPG